MDLICATVTALIQRRTHTDPGARDTQDSRTCSCHLDDHDNSDLGACARARYASDEYRLD